MKKQLLWIGALLLCWTTISVVPGIFGWAVMEGFSGLVIQFFFAFCALILVAQVFSVLAALRDAAVEARKRRKAVDRALNW